MNIPLILGLIVLGIITICILAANQPEHDCTAPRLNKLMMAVLVVAMPPIVISHLLLFCQPAALHGATFQQIWNMTSFDLIEATEHAPARSATLTSDTIKDRGRIIYLYKFDDKGCETTYPDAIDYLTEHDVDASIDYVPTTTKLGQSIVGADNTDDVPTFVCNNSAGEQLIIDPLTEQGTLDYNKLDTIIAFMQSNSNLQTESL